jgi:hypothetical protein
VGDVLTISAVVTSVLTTLTTTVTGFVGEPVAAVTGTSSIDAGNQATQLFSESISQTAGTPVNDIVAVVDGSGYDSLDDGGAARTYTVTCIQASTGSDATTALLRVQSSDGLDDVASVAPAAFGDPTAVGTKGLEITFDLDPVHSSASSFGLQESDFIVGQQWVAIVAQAFARPTHASGGTYTGTRDDHVRRSRSRRAAPWGRTPSRSRSRRPAAPTRPGRRASPRRPRRCRSGRSASR